MFDLADPVNAVKYNAEVLVYILKGERQLES